jgi:hypothetical protein
MIQRRLFLPIRNKLWFRFKRSRPDDRKDGFGGISSDKIFRLRVDWQRSQQRIGEGPLGQFGLQFGRRHRSTPLSGLEVLQNKIKSFGAI